MVRDLAYYLLPQQKYISKKDQTLRHLLWAMDLHFLLREQPSGKKKNTPLGHPDFITFSAQNLLEWMKPGIRNAHNMLAPMLGKAPP